MPTKLSSLKNPMYLAFRAYLGNRNLWLKVIKVSFYRNIVRRNCSCDEGLKGTPFEQQLNIGVIKANLSEQEKKETTLLSLSLSNKCLNHRAIQ